MYRFLIVDDHPITRRGLQEILLESYPKAQIVAVTAYEEAMAQLVKADWDIVISDISMPGRSGLDILADIAKEFPKIPVLILSMYSEEEYAVRVIKAGGAGYLSKEEALDTELVKAVNLILSGRKYITPTLAEKLAFELSNDTDKELHQLLSDREFQIFQLIAKGKSTGKIAEQLSLSVNTIGTFRRRILEKMNMKSTADIVTYAVRNNLL